MRTFRAAVAAVLLLVAVVFAVGPTLLGEADTDGYEDQIEAIQVLDDLNNDRTEGAPQQQVVNGWTAIDFLELQARQNNDLLVLQQRQLALLLVIALLVGWSVLTQKDRGIMGQEARESLTDSDGGGLESPSQDPLATSATDGDPKASASTNPD